MNRCQDPLDPFRFVLIAVAGWVNQCQLQAIDCLREENRVLQKQLGDRRLRLTDDQHRRLAANSKGLGRNVLAEVASIVTPETLLAWPPSQRSTLAGTKTHIARNADGVARPRITSPT